MSAAFDVDDVPASAFETVARKFLTRTFDPEFFAALFTASAWLIRKGAELMHPAMGSSEGMTAAMGAAAQILEHAGQPVEMGGILQAVILRKALQVVWREVQQFDWAAMILNLLVQEPAVQ
jgi:hypothetical protein